MTALIGGSIILIVVASVSLVMGWAGTNEPLIYTSITSSVASFVCLALAYYRSKAEARRVVAAADVAEGIDPVELIDEEPPDDQLVETTAEDAPLAATPTQDVAKLEEDAAVEDAAVEDAAPVDADEVPLAGTQEIEAVSDDQPVPAEAGLEEVVVFVQRRKYHRPECRYAGAAGGERMPKEVPVSRGYDACRTCKP